MTDIFTDVCRCDSVHVPREVMEQVLYLAVEIAREGREGRKIGTLFVIGDPQEILPHTRTLILDPLLGHPRAAKRLGDPHFRETVKELAQLDGAFVVDREGVVVSAARYIGVDNPGIDVPLGLGSRHIAAASITSVTDSAAVVVSESSMVRVFSSGHLLSEIIPEVWMLRSYAHRLLGADVSQRVGEALTVVTRRD